MRTPDSSFVFRLVKEEDFNELYDLLNNLPENVRTFFHPHAFDLQTITEICTSKKDHYFVMEQNNKIIGYSFLRLFGYETPSYGCCVRNGYQGIGYGTVLTQETMKKAKELGYHKVILKVYKENVAAFKTYENIGFKIVGETDDKRQYKMEINLSSKD
jgi:RimJ/RimL family protein N-acetyltransferase